MKARPRAEGDGQQCNWFGLVGDVVMSVVRCIHGTLGTRYSLYLTRYLSLSLHDTHSHLCTYLLSWQVSPMQFPSGVTRESVEKNPCP
jgi:hypothetical protein